MKKRLAGIAFLMSVVLLAASFTACSAGSSGAPQAASSMAAAEDDQNGVVSSGAAAEKDSLALGTTSGSTSSGAESPSSNSAAAAVQAKRKIIERLNYVIETLKFDEAVAQVQNLCTSLNGYIQDSNVTGSGILEKGTLRHAIYTLRIPQENLPQLKEKANTIGTVLSFSSSSENVSEQYYDTEARLKSLRTQQERLLALLQKSGSLTDIIALEKALADVNYQIEELTGTLKQYDSLIQYSTVTIRLNEVIQPTQVEREPVTLGDKISHTFRQSVHGLASFGEGLLVFLLGCSPVLIFIILIVAVIYWFAWGRKNRRRRQKSPQPVEPEHLEKSNQTEEKHSDKNL